jgi:cell division protein FtsW
LSNPSRDYSFLNDPSMTDKLKNHLQGDKQIWWILGLLSLISIVTVYSSISSLAYRQAGGNTEAVILRHALFLFLGFVVTYFVHLLDISKYAHIAKILLYISPFLLIYTLIFGVSIGNAKRWINVMGMSFQTADLVKLVLIVNLAAMLASKIHIEYKKKDLFEIITWCGIIILLISVSSFSSAIILGFTCFTIMWIGKVPGRYLRALTAVIVGVISFVLITGYLIRLTTGKEIGRISTVIDRTEVFINKDLDRDGYVGGYLGGKSTQKNYAHVAIARGGIIGVGPGNSSQKNVLPEAYSDYIYSIVIEEYGLVGGLFVLALYLWLLARGIKNIDFTERAFGGLLCVGLTLLLVFQAFAHMAINVGLGPVTGQTLPLISRGGTSALFSFVALGIVLSVSKHSKAA